MTEDFGVRPGGNRRIDRLLAEEHDVRGLGIDDLRELRDDAEQEETDASYVRRLLQGRIDIVEAELRRRGGADGDDLVAQLPRILADTGRTAAPRGLGRHTAVEPSERSANRRSVEQLVADPGLSDVAARSDGELHDALGVFRAEEQRLSATRKALQALMDAATAELTRRYRDGEADPAALLPSAPPERPGG